MPVDAQQARLIVLNCAEELLPSPMLKVDGPFFCAHRQLPSTLLDVHDHFPVAVRLPQSRSIDCCETPRQQVRVKM